MTVKQLYNQYLIPPNLQKHMLRVAALSQILTENWHRKNLDKDSITLACVFHDMANIIKFKLDQPQLFKEEGSQIDYWKKIQRQTIEKYGTDIHAATFKICQEIGLSEKILFLIKNMNWNNTLEVLEKNDFASAILIYCDMRIGPYGIMLLKDRIENLSTRNNNFDFNILQKNAKILEEILQKNISVDLNDINDTQLNERFQELLGLKI